MRDTQKCILPLDLYIDKIERALWKVVQISKERTNQTKIIPIQDYSSGK